MVEEYYNLELRRKKTVGDTTDTHISLNRILIFKAFISKTRCIQRSIINLKENKFKNFIRNVKYYF